MSLAPTLTGHPKIMKKYRISTHLFRGRRWRKGPRILGKPDLRAMLDDGIRRDGEVHVDLAGGVHPELSKAR